MASKSPVFRSLSWKIFLRPGCLAGCWIRYGSCFSKRAKKTERVMDTSIVYLNGEWLPLSNARISVLDRGFILGDGVYEVIPVYAAEDGRQRRPFRLEQHLARFARSLAKIQLANPFGVYWWMRSSQPIPLKIQATALCIFKSRAALRRARRLFRKTSHRPFL